MPPVRRPRRAEWRVLPEPGPRRPIATAPPPGSLSTIRARSRSSRRRRPREAGSPRATWRSRWPGARSRTSDRRWAARHESRERPDRCCRRLRPCRAGGVREYRQPALERTRRWEMCRVDRGSRSTRRHLRTRRGRFVLSPVAARPPRQIQGLHRSNRASAAPLHLGPPPRPKPFRWRPHCGAADPRLRSPPAGRNDRSDSRPRPPDGSA